MLIVRIARELLLARLHALIIARMQSDEAYIHAKTSKLVLDMFLLLCLDFSIWSALYKGPDFLETFIVYISSKLTK